MTRQLWVGAGVAVLAMVVLVAILMATATPRDPGADALLYLERAHGTAFRVVKSERDSKLHDGFPDQYEVTCVRVDDAGQDTGEPFRITVNYDKGLAVRGGGHSWSGDYCRGEAAALQQAAAAALDRPLSAIRLYPRITFASREELATWGPLSADPQRAFEVDLVVFGSAEAQGPAVAEMLAAWLPRWKTARKARVVVAFCGDRREKVDEPFKGTGYGWRHNTDTLWTIELEGDAIGAATVASIAEHTVTRHPAKEVEAEQGGG